MAAQSRRWIVDIIIVLVVLIVDRAVKLLSLYWLVPGVPVKVGSFVGVDLCWTLTYNQGAAWGMFDGSPLVLLLFRLFFVALLCGMYVLSRMPPLVRTSLALIIAGACGNIIDTVVWGHVVDMIHLQFWGWNYPIFNAADMSICIGSVAIFMLMVPGTGTE